MYSFDYQRPGDRAAAAAAAKSSDARYLAGGQTLIQAMKLRLSSSERLVDLGAIADLKGIKVDGSSVTIGATTTHATVARSAEVQKAIPALAELAGGIGDQMVRNVGTIGGSIANADPAACYPAAVLGLGATVNTDRRSIAADSFFTGMYETALQPGELIVSVSFPVPQKAAYVKYKQPASRFALVGVFVSQGAGWRARGRHRGQEQRVPCRRDRGGTDAEPHAWRGQGGEAAGHRHEQRPARLGRLPRGDGQRDGRARRRKGAGALIDCRALPRGRARDDGATMVPSAP